MSAPDETASYGALVAKRSLNKDGIANRNRRLGRTDSMLCTAGNGQPLDDRWRGIATACDDDRHDKVERIRIELRGTSRQE